MTGNKMHRKNQKLRSDKIQHVKRGGKQEKVVVLGCNDIIKFTVLGGSDISH